MPLSQDLGTISSDRMLEPRCTTLTLLLLGSLSITASSRQLPPPSPLDQQPEQALPDAPAVAAEAPTVFPHPASSRYLLSGQANIIFQAHGPFHSPYSGPNSLLGRGEYKTSLLGTLYLGLNVLHTARTSTGPPPRHRILRRSRHLGGPGSLPASPTSMSFATLRSAPGPTSPVSSSTRPSASPARSSPSTAPSSRSLPKLPSAASISTLAS